MLWHYFGIPSVADHGEEATIGLVQNSRALLVEELLFETAHRSEFHYEMILSPTIDAISVVMKNSRQNAKPTSHSPATMRIIQSLVIPNAYLRAAAIPGVSF